jgi:DNA-binding GntR family transcriptional regulator
MDTKFAVTDAASAIEPIRPVSRSSTSDIVYERLREVILNVTILPNAVLSENDLANTLQVSRTPIRAAIHRLSGEGLIYVVPQVGTFVAPMDLARIREALFMREAVECAAMDRLPNPIPVDAIDALNKIVDTHKEAADSRDIKQTLTSDEDFHRLLLELAGVKGVWRYVHDVRETHRRVRVLTHQHRRDLAQSEFEVALRSAHQHAEIVAALTASKWHKAKGLLGDHIRENLAYTEEIALKHPAFFTAPMNSAQPVAARKF